MSSGSTFCHEAPPSSVRRMPVLVPARAVEELEGEKAKPKNQPAPPASPADQLSPPSPLTRGRGPSATSSQEGSPGLTATVAMPAASSPSTTGRHGGASPSVE